MTFDMWLTLGILAAALVLFVTEWVRMDIVALGVVITLMLTGLLTVDEALAGFSNNAVITIVALFIVGGAIVQTGLARVLGGQILRIAGNSQARLTIVIMLAAALLSGFMSNTGVVAVLLPAVVSLANEAKIPPSKLLLPLAYGSLLGGVATIIGTPPNIIVTDIMRDAGFQPFGFFSFLPVGVVFTAIGITYMLVAGRRLLPAHQPHREVQRVDSPQELLDLYRLPDNLYRLRVRQKSPMVGQTVVESGLGARFNISALEVLRRAPAQTVARVGDQRLVLESDSQERIYAVADVILQPDDILIVQGDGRDVQHAAASLNLAIQPAAADDHESLIAEEVGIAEVILPPRSSVIGKTLAELKFGSVYNLTVLDIRRAGEDGRLSLKDTRLAFGDTLLVLGEWKNIMELKERRRDFIVMGEPEALAGLPARKKAPVVLVVLLMMVVLMVTGLVPLATASLLAALLIVLTGCLSMDEAYESIDWKSIVLIAGMLPLATALEKVGLVNLIAESMTNMLGDQGPLLIMAGFYLLTAVFTQVLSNTATAVLVGPIALATAARLGLQPHAFVMAVAVTASMALASPMSTPGNTLVMSAGNYSFSDYVKNGVPLILLCMVAALLVLPLLFPM